MSKTYLLVQNDINYSTAEETGPRLIRRAISQAANDLKKITIQTVYSDVLVFSLLSAERLILAGMKSIFALPVKKNYSEEFVSIKIFKKSGADIC